MMPTEDGVVRPDVKQFDRFFPIFLGNRPDLQCPKGYVLLFAHSTLHTEIKKTFMRILIISLDRGLGAYDKAVVRDETGEIIGTLSQNGKTTANLTVKM